MGSRSAGVLLVVAGCLLGCDTPQAQFQTDLVYFHNQAARESAEVTPRQRQDVAELLAAMFGTPDEPFVLQTDAVDLTDLVRPTSLKLAAGPVGSDALGRPTGLYREHCSHCHGVTGDGRGPTAEFLNPYPRDYRRGVYKFKSTPRGSRPRHDDLKRVLINGVAGTAMPSFKLLSDAEIEALVDYVKYLSLRGEVERALIEETTDLEADERLVDEDDPASAANWLELVGDVADKWRRAADEVTPVPPRPDWQGQELLASIEKGKQLFYGSVANCASCHGDSQLGDGQVTDYDDWVKDYADDWIKATDPVEKERKWQELAAFDALPPRNSMPRNLRAGVYRGGRRPVDLYWRIHDGIDGSPMPAAMMRQEGQEVGLSSEDLWHLVNYVLSLPYEEMRTSVADQPVYSRPRM